MISAAWAGRLGLLLGLLFLSAACQSPEVARQELRAGPLPPRPAATVLVPDSLQLTPLAPLAAVPDSLRRTVQVLHKRLGPAAATLRPAVLERACIGYLNLRKAGRVRRAGVLAVADMDLPSSEKRLWVIDLRKAEVLQHSPVAHGRGSGHLRARRFSNTIKSACTALGFYATQDTYEGKHGLSRRLRGLDAGQNDNALRRYVVLHAADYVSRRHLERHGQAGNSRGCPALPPEQYRAIISAVADGSCLLLSGPGLESNWLDGASAAERLAARGWM
ncbi:murein L,D-transpeptidase catalytic domain family protein [Hymenobacter sp. BT18]|uniref:murein L,D-transpeptidase catalytic domain family protein n=1 Tax=Hymenobacter TaxID=89966 RepID=UPI00143E91C8|nr:MULTISPECIES: murein L,D-transpeptidase catalytic domain family protein [Hymenobacter]QIX61057.1 murein L,D-transpeptidase catalytic domain family protein [Hymenobacter sp. BT18]